MSVQQAVLLLLKAATAYLDGMVGLAALVQAGAVAGCVGSGCNGVCFVLGASSARVLFTAMFSGTVHGCRNGVLTIRNGYGCGVLTNGDHHMLMQMLPLTQSRVITS